MTKNNDQQDDDSRALLARKTKRGTVQCLNTNIDFSFGIDLVDEQGRPKNKAGYYKWGEAVKSR